MECVLYIFRATDLRLFDNRALAAAFSRNKPVLLAACLDADKNFTRQWFKLPAGGALRRRFHVESVLDVGKNLTRVLPTSSAQSMSPLSIYFGGSVDFFQTVLSNGHIKGSLDGQNSTVKDFKVSEVFVSREHGTYERKEEEALKSLCQKNQITFNCFDDSTMLDFERFTQHFHDKVGASSKFSKFPDQFTEFRGLVEKELGRNFASDGSGCSHPPAQLFCDKMTGNVVDHVFACADKEECLSTENFNVVRNSSVKAPIIQLDELSGASLSGGGTGFICGPSNSAMIIDSLNAFIAEAENIQIGNEKLILPSLSISPNRFVGGETAALERLNKFIWGEKDDKDSRQNGKTPLSTYKDTRNKSMGDTYSSKFSMYLSLGCLSPRTILHEVNKFEHCFFRSDSTYWLVFELLWRDFMKFAFVKHGDNFFHKNGLQRKPNNWWTGKRKIVFNEKEYVAFLTGNTGFPYVDAHMRELIQTGFMGNRGRQNVASFLVYNMNMDWRLGCELFEHFLLDHDTLSNAGNWQTIAGIGFQQRENRFNIVKQSLQYEKSGAFIKTWLPELMCIPAAHVHTPWDYLADSPSYCSPSSTVDSSILEQNPLAIALREIPPVYFNPIRPPNSFYYEKPKNGSGGGAWGGDWVEGGNIKIPSYSSPGQNSSKGHKNKKQQNGKKHWKGKAAAEKGETK